VLAPKTFTCSFLSKVHNFPLGMGGEAPNLQAAQEHKYSEAEQAVQPGSMEARVSCFLGTST
jgi:hypothetical protein